MKPKPVNFHSPFSCSHWFPGDSNNNRLPSPIALDVKDALVISLEAAQAALTARGPMPEAPNSLEPGIRVITTKMMESCAAGAVKIQVVSQSGFSLGMKVVIDVGALAESRVIAAFGSIELVLAQY